MESAAVQRMAIPTAMAAWGRISLTGPSPSSGPHRQSPTVSRARAVVKA